MSTDASDELNVFDWFKTLSIMIVSVSPPQAIFFGLILVPCIRKFDFRFFSERANFFPALRGTGEKRSISDCLTNKNDTFETIFKEVKKPTGKVILEIKRMWRMHIYGRLAYMYYSKLNCG